MTASATHETTVDAAVKNISAEVRSALSSIDLDSVPQIHELRQRVEQQLASAQDQLGKRRGRVSEDVGSVSEASYSATRIATTVIMGVTLGVCLGLALSRLLAQMLPGDPTTPPPLTRKSRPPLPPAPRRR